jgi:hypothetical protein
MSRKKMLGMTKFVALSKNFWQKPLKNVFTPKKRGY